VFGDHLLDDLAERRVRGTARFAFPMGGIRPPPIASRS
jgi:hypothetical protein